MTRKKPNPQIVAFTVIAKNYLPQALLFVESLHRQHPDWLIHIYFIDNQKIDVKSAFVSNINDVSIPRAHELRLQYSLLEFSTAVKPWVFLHLFKQKYSKVFYFDPDIYIYNSLDKLVEVLNEYDIVLTPHINEQYTDSFLPNERDFLQVGIYNLGFVGFSASPASNSFITWWGRQLLDYGFADPESFQFTDQKWMDFAPSLLNAKILHAEGYNIAYWNLHQYLRNSNTIFFIHFSGLSNISGSISKFQNRFNISNIGKFKSYFADYSHLLEIKQNELNHANKQYKYSNDSFSDSEITISPAIRKMYVYAERNNLFVLGNRPTSDFLNYLLSKHQSGLPNILVLLYKTQSDVREQFSQSYLANGIERNSFLQWAFHYGLESYGIDLELRSRIASMLNYDAEMGMRIEFFPLEIIRLPVHSFLSVIYKRYLFRRIDLAGLESNIADYESGRANKFTLLYRVLNSEEYAQKHRITLRDSMIKNSVGVLGAPPVILSKISKSFKISEPINNETSNFGLNHVGYFSTESGVADSARGLVLALDEAKVPTNLFNIEQPYLRSENHELQQRYSLQSDKFATLVSVNADQAIHVLDESLPKSHSQKKYLIGYWYWESDIFPINYFPAFSRFKEIWTATSYIQDVLSKVSPIPVLKIPPSFEFHKYPRFNFKKFGVNLKEKDKLVLQVFDSNSFVERKNPEATFKAFAIAVQQNPHLHLLIKTTNIAAHQESKQMFDSYQSTIPNVHFIDEYLPQNEIESLIQSCDIYLSLHRSEGLGIPLIKAMLAGIPTIATAFGGNTDFMNAENSFLVQYQPYILQSSIGPYQRGSFWADPDVEQAADYLVSISKNYRTVSSDSISQYFSKERIGVEILNRLMNLVA